MRTGKHLEHHPTARCSSSLCLHEVTTIVYRCCPHFEIRRRLPGTRNPVHVVVAKNQRGAMVDNLMG